MARRGDGEQNAAGAGGGASPNVAFGAPLFDTAGPKSFAKELEGVAKQAERIQASFLALDKLDLGGLRSAIASLAGSTQTLAQGLKGVGTGGGIQRGGQWGPTQPSQTGGKPNGGQPAPTVNPDGTSVSTFSATRAVLGGAMAATGAAQRFMAPRMSGMYDYNLAQNRLGLGSGQNPYQVTTSLLGSPTFGAIAARGGILAPNVSAAASMGMGMQGMAGGVVGGTGLAGQTFAGIARQQSFMSFANPGTAASGEQLASLGQFFSPQQQALSRMYMLPTPVGRGGVMDPNAMFSFATAVARRTQWGNAPMTAQQIAAQSGPNGQLYQNLMRATGGNEQMVSAQLTYLQGQARYRQQHGQDLNITGLSATDVGKRLGLSTAQSSLLLKQTAQARQEAGLVPGEANATTKFNDAVARFENAVTRFEGLAGGRMGGIAGMALAGGGHLASPLSALGALGNAWSIASLGKTVLGLGKTIFGGGNGAASTGEAADVAGTAEVASGGTVAAGAGAGAGAAVGVGLVAPVIGEAVGKPIGKAINRHMPSTFRKKDTTSQYFRPSYWLKRGLSHLPIGDGTGSVTSAGTTYPQLEDMTKALGLPFTVTSTTGGGHAKNSYHYKGEAIDIAPPSGGQDNDGLRSLNNALASKYGSGLSELIYSGPGGIYIKDGRVVSASVYSDVLGEHHNHVHVAASPGQLQKIGKDLGVTTTAGKSSGGNSGLSKVVGLIGSALGEGNNYSEAALLAGFGRVTASTFSGGSQGNTTGNGGSGTSSTGQNFSSYPQVPESKGGGVALTKSQLDSAISTALGIMKMSDSDFHAGIAALIGHESGGKPGDVNDWDSNAKAGHPSIGLMQTIQGTFNEYALPGHGDITNPVDNIIAGTRYAMKNYGPGMLKGGGRHDKNGNYIGYDRGTYNVDHDQMALLHKGEMVVRSADANIARDRASRGGGPAVIHFDKGSIQIALSGATEKEAEKFVDMILGKIEERTYQHDLTAH